MPGKTPSSRDSIRGKSQMADLVRAHDWSSTPLGPIDHWSDILLSSVNLMLACAFPSLVCWGTDLVQLYNDAFIPLLAERHPSSLGQTARECWSDAWQIVGPNLKRVMDDQATVYDENTIVPIVRNGKLQDVRWTYSYSPIFGSGGAVLGVLVICQDIPDVTEERKAREALKDKSEQAERQLAEIETVYRTAPIGLALFDTKDFRYLRLNDRQAEFFGLKPEQVVGRTLTEMAPIEGLRELFEQVLAGQPVVNFPLEGELVTRPGEHRYWTVSYFPVFAVDGTVQAISAASLEITQQKKAELALMQSEKLAVVGRLAASIAHEINNPLESVTNLLYLAEHSEDLEKTRTYVQTAERELRRVSVIANQTLRFHKQSSSPQEISGVQLIESVISMFQSRFVNAGIRVEERERTTSTVRCFEGEIRQVLSNLVSNAIDAMHPLGGGRLLLRSHVRREWPTGRRGLVITVADTGSGIPASVANRIFEPFYTTKGASGTGLGLWVSNEIVRRHDGTLRFRSSEKEGRSGTVFALFLPFDAVSR
jgi:PAS domain S-box-containing protein